MIVGLHGVDFVVGELGTVSRRSEGIPQDLGKCIRESLDEGVLISDLATLLGDLLFRLVELSRIGVLLESYLMVCVLA